jgi:hypothetical protein
MVVELPHSNGMEPTRRHVFREDQVNRPTHSLEASIGNLSTCLYLDRDKGEYWITVPTYDLEAIVEFAKIKLREENK